MLLLLLGVLGCLTAGISPTLAAPPTPAAGAGFPIGFRLKTGSTYSYEVTQRTQTQFKAFEQSGTEPWEDKTEVTVTVLGFRQGIYILDIWEDTHHYRRFMRADGMLVGAPGEGPSGMPFLISFPAGRWQVGKAIGKSVALPVGGGRTVPARWTATLAEVKTDKKMATITLAGDVSLPSDRVTQRSLTMKGRLAMNLEEGCPDEGEWTLTYSLACANKEIAVIRDLWSMNETRSVSFRLKGVVHE